MAILVEARNADLVRLGPLVWSQLEINIKYNRVGSWSMTLPASDRNWDLTRREDFNGILVNWNGVYEYSGFCESWGYKLDSSGDGAAESIVISGADDLALVANRFLYAQPANTWVKQSASEDTTNAQYADKQTGPLETVIKHYVTANLLTAGDTTRRVPRLTVAADQQRGNQVTYKIRFPALMDAIRTLAADGGPMGVRILQDGDGLVFDCYVPRDLSDKAWFSTFLGNLSEVDLTETAATATNALVAGAGTGTSRDFIEVTGDGHDDPWAHVETFVDQRQALNDADDKTNPTPEEQADALEQMQQAGQDAVTQGAAAATLAVTALDLPLLRFGRDDLPNKIQGYDLGDTVTVEIHPGVTYTDIISAVKLSAEGGEETVTPTIGAADSDTAGDDTITAQLTARVRDLERRLRSLETI